MSGILDRMAKRALGVLPTIEPLIVARHVQPAEAWSESSPELETNLEAEAPTPAPAPVSLRRMRRVKADGEQPVREPAPLVGKESRRRVESAPGISAPEAVRPPISREIRRGQARAPTDLESKSVRDSGGTKQEPVETVEMQGARMELGDDLEVEPVGAVEPMEMIQTEIVAFHQPIGVR